MKKRTIALLLILTIACSIFLVSCDDDSLDSKYVDFLNKYTEEEQVENNKNALDDYIIAYNNTSTFTSYSMKIDASLKYGNLIPTKGSANGTIKKENGNYSGKLSVKFANISLMEFGYSAETEDTSYVDDEEIGKIELPFNLASVGGAIYLDLIDGDTSSNNKVLQTATLVYNAPETLKFTLTPEETIKYYPEFADLKDMLQDVEIPMIDFENVAFNNTIVYVTVENKIVTSYEVVISGSASGTNFTCNLKGSIIV